MYVGAALSLVPIISTIDATVSEHLHGRRCNNQIVSVKDGGKFPMGCETCSLELQHLLDEFQMAVGVGLAPPLLLPGIRRWMSGDFNARALYALLQHRLHGSRTTTFHLHPTEPRCICLDCRRPSATHATCSCSSCVSRQAKHVLVQHLLAAV